MTRVRARARRLAPSGDSGRPVLFVTNHAPPFRLPAFSALHEQANVVFALIGGDVRHGGGGTSAALPFPAVFPAERAVARMAASGKYRAVVAGLSGKVALPAAYAGARAGRLPFVLWATIWRHPRTLVHAASYAPLRHIYRHADAIATYGPHVSAYVATKHPTGAVFEAPQSVDLEFWTARAEPERHGDFQILYAGRLEREKGVDVLAEAYDREDTLVLAGEGPLGIPGSIRRGRCDATDLRNLYAGSDVVVIPSIPTRDFLEPWGLVANEAFHQGVPVIATNAVGAAAGGLVRHEHTGLVVPAGDAGALRGALRRLREDPALRARLGAAGRAAAATHTPAAWADGMGRALASAQKGLLA
jgi:glycosyltransferase involved in cell wall biosynthesis